MSTVRDSYVVILLGLVGRKERLNAAKSIQPYLSLIRLGGAQVFLLRTKWLKTVVVALMQLGVSGTGAVVTHIIQAINDTPRCRRTRTPSTMHMAFRAPVQAPPGSHYHTRLLDES